MRDKRVSARYNEAMHDDAKAWDRAHHFTPAKGVKPPAGRPCDWCGRPVAEGAYIHAKPCLEEERKLYLEIALD